MDTDIVGSAPATWRQAGRRSQQMRLIPTATLATLYAKSDARGIARTLAHATLLAVGIVAIHASRGHWWVAVPVVLHGIVLVSLFSVMHECVHDSAFRTRRLNEIVGGLAGAAILYVSAYYRQFHFAHHRYTQDPRRDPELLTAPPPRSRAAYWWRASALPYWGARLGNLIALSRGRFEGLDWVTPGARASVSRSARLLAALVVAAAVGSTALSTAALVWYWLLPLACGLPFLRLYLLSEHTGCTEDDDGLTNTRTTISLWPVRFLMWNLPYHAEHHLYPSVPFYRLPAAHRALRAHLRVVAAGYIEVHRSLYAALRADNPRSDARR